MPEDHGLLGVCLAGATGAELVRPYFLALLAEACGIIGQPEAGLTALVEALMLVDTTGECWCESECYRLKGEFLLQLSSDNQAEAETCSLNLSGFVATQNRAK